jgi:diguanylate cyclase (GGDEF)-like protein
MARVTANPTRGSPIEAAAKHRTHSWDDAPLRGKVAALVIAAACGGCLVGFIEAQNSTRVWLAPAGVSLVIVVLLLVARRWVWRPYEKLVDTLERITRTERPATLGDLPLTRRDEVGKLARSLHQLTSWAIRDHRDAHLMRKTMDARVEQATRRATRQLRHLAMRDALTDLGNRHFLDDNLDPLVNSVRESGDDLLCMAIDVDHFKQINDTLGHAAGDELLILIGSLIRGSIRGNDYAVRLGGDEFVVLLPGCDPDRARELADRLRSLFVHHTRTSMRTEAQVSLSVGIASLQNDRARDGRNLLEIADAKLYEAKRLGKGRTVGG